MRRASSGSSGIWTSQCFGHANSRGDPDADTDMLERFDHLAGYRMSPPEGVDGGGRGGESLDLPFQTDAPAIQINEHTKDNISIRGIHNYNKT